MTKTSRKKNKKSRDKHTTPAMRQYKAFKDAHPDCVLFFRMGDFYELFYEDAELCHRAIGLTLTQRTEGIPMAGVPYHAVESYLRKLMDQGYRVAIADQIQDPKDAKGVVDRAVTRVLTPGTLVDDSLLEDGTPNQIAAVAFVESGDQSAACIAVSEVSTGAFELFHADAASLPSELARLGLNELIFAETSTGETPHRIDAAMTGFTCAITPRPSWHFRHTEARDCLMSQFSVKTLAGFGLSDEDPAIGAAGALVRYLHETQCPESVKKGDAKLHHLRPPMRRKQNHFVSIDATSLQSLEIERTIRGGETAGSLLGELQHARTPMGKRLLRHWLCFPLRDLDEIHKRQRCVGAMIEDRAFADDLDIELKAMSDVARIAARIAMGRALPRDLVGLGISLGRIDRFCDLLDARPAFLHLRKTLADRRNAIEPIAHQIESMCVDSPPAHMRDGGLIRDGADQKLDKIRTLQRDASTWLADYQQKIINESGVTSLKVGYNKVFGYYIEVSARNSERVPDWFIRKQTLKNAERYITPDLKTFEAKILSADQRALEREQKLFADLCEIARSITDAIVDFAETVAQLDVLHSFSEQAIARGYIRPDVVPKSIINIEGGRHPVLDALLREQFVPNDCHIGYASDESGGIPETLALITGPNMAGKSTYIRQIALLTLLAHTGSYIPADSATIGLTDQIFTRIGASDELHAGRSTFMVEMTETANILHHATSQSLVILDEIGRGTSTLDGLSLAWAITEHLAALGPRTLFATHYHEITSIADRLAGACNLHVAVREWEEDIIFLYRIFPGRTDRSYGIHVAKIAGLPQNVLQRARDVLSTLEVQTEENKIVANNIPPATDTQTQTQSGAQMPLFTEFLPHPVLEELRATDLDSLTPLQAFDLLRRLSEEV